MSGCYSFAAVTRVLGHLHLDAFGHVCFPREANPSRAENAMATRNHTPHVRRRRDSLLDRYRLVLVTWSLYAARWPGTCIVPIVVDSS
jgi:hypothetical protein